ncbi:hypothetical protein V8246_07260 [Pseudoxanthomonas sp. F11]|uniref:hypothetical protein n=1 Tax=Pseudoxanthomonas sp. F11 TaxID=3126308 RepID=UPI00300C98CE
MRDVDDQKDPSDLTDEFIKLFRAAAPERSQELDTLLEGVSNLVLRGGDQVGFVMESNSWFIRFSQRSLEAVWVLATSGAQAVELYSGAIWAAQVGMLDLSELESADPSEATYVKALRSNVNNAIDCLNSPDALHCKPIRPLNSGNLFEVLADDCVQLAVAFVFLHELKHRIKDQEETAELEERRADEFALDWLLGAARTYAKESGHEVGKVVAKRGMGIALAMFVIASLSPLKGSTGDPHPSPLDRLRRLLDLVKETVPEQTSFWIIAAAVIFGVLRVKGLPINVDAKGVTHQDLATRLLDALAEVA